MGRSRKKSNIIAIMEKLSMDNKMFWWTRGYDFKKDYNLLKKKKNSDELDCNYLCIGKKKFF